MSDQTIKPLCQWGRGCAAEASKHVTYNYQSQGVVESNERGVKLGFVLSHANLCPQHLKTLRQNCGDVHEVELGRCNEDCPTK